MDAEIPVTRTYAGQHILQPHGPHFIQISGRAVGYHADDAEGFKGRHHISPAEAVLPPDLLRKILLHRHNHRFRCFFNGLIKIQKPQPVKSGIRKAEGDRHHVPCRAPQLRIHTLQSFIAVPSGIPGMIQSKAVLLVSRIGRHHIGDAGGVKFLQCF